MRRKAHQLMWPGKPYIDDRPPPAPGIDSRGQPQIKSAAKIPSPNAAKIPAPNAGKMPPPNAAKVPAPNAVKESAPNAGSPGRPVDEAREPYKPLMNPDAQYFTQTRQSKAAGVEYEPTRPVQNAIQRFERKSKENVRSPNRPQPGMDRNGELQMKPANKLPAPNEVKESAPKPGSPGGTMDGAREL